jgi:hypothetical protein
MTYDSVVDESFLISLSLSLSLSFKLSKEGSSSLPVFHSLVHPLKVVVDESHPTGLLLDLSKSW